MKKVFILNFLILSSLGLQLKAMESDLTVQNGDIKSQAISNSKQDKGFFANHEEKFKAKRIRKKINNLKNECHVEPKTCSVWMTAITGIGCFITGILAGLGMAACVLYNIFH